MQVTTDYFNSHIEDLQRKIQSLKMLVRELDDHEGAEGWSIGLSEQIEKVLTEDPSPILFTVICQNDYPVGVTLDHAAAVQRKKNQTQPDEGIFIHLHQFPLS